MIISLVVLNETILDTGLALQISPRRPPGAVFDALNIEERGERYYMFRVQ